MKNVFFVLIAFPVLALSIVPDSLRPALAAESPDAALSPALKEYVAHGDTDRLNVPADYIAYLKRSRFKNGELDNLPRTAIVLYASEPEDFIKAAGDTLVKTIEIGTAAANRLCIAKRKSGATYIVNPGLPGAGGIATQAAELGALGVKAVIHLGTCAALGGTADEKTVLVSTGSYKDGAAVMLAEKNAASARTASRPDADLAASLDKALNSRKRPVADALGYTIPIYYFQPSGLIAELFSADSYPEGRPLYLEMEEASFYESARRAGVKAASAGVPADKYVLAAGKVSHEFLGDTSPALHDAFNAAVDVLERFGQ